MKDIADRIGVSKNTVSLALRNRPGVSSDTRERILDAAIELNYAGFGRLKRESETIVVVLLPESIHADNPFYHPVILGMEQYASGQGISAIIRTLTADQERKRILPAPHSGLLIAGVITVGRIGREYIDMLIKRGIPMVVVDNSYEELHIDCVLTDNHGGAVMATKYLLDMGHRRIGYCGPVSYAMSFAERWSGFVDTMSRSGVTDCARYSLTDYASSIEEIHSPDHLFACLGRLPEMPTAFFCGNDRIALAMLNALRRLELQVPGDVSLVGFDNQLDVNMLVPPLTTVNVSRRAMGRRAVEMLIDRLNGKHPEPVCLRLYTDLIVRDSVGEPAR